MEEWKSINLGKCALLKTFILSKKKVGYLYIDKILSKQIIEIKNHEKFVLNKIEEGKNGWKLRNLTNTRINFSSIFFYDIE